MSRAVERHAETANEQEVPDMSESSGEAVVVANLVHDLATKQSVVTLVWQSDATKRVVLPVPFGTSLTSVQAEAEAALRRLSCETAALLVQMPG